MREGPGSRAMKLRYAAALALLIALFGCAGKAAPPPDDPCRVLDDPTSLGWCESDRAASTANAAPDDHEKCVDCSPAKSPAAPNTSY